MAYQCAAWGILLVWMGGHSNVQAQYGTHLLLLRIVGLYTGIAMCRCTGMYIFLCIRFGSSPSDTYLAPFALHNVICNPEQQNGNRN